MGDDMIGKKFEGRSFSHVYAGFLHGRLIVRAVNAGRGGRRQAHLSVSFLNDSCGQEIPADESARGVEQQEISRAVGKLARSERLQRKPEATLRKNGFPVAVRKPQAEEAVAPNSFRIRRAGRGESSR